LKPCRFATPPPAPWARLVKTAILNRDQGRDRLREALEEGGLAEVPRLEEKLNLLATIAQLAPLIGLLGTVLGFIQTFSRMQEDGLNAHVGQLSSGVWQALVCAAAGLAVAIPRGTPATTTWSAALTPSCSTWNAPPLKSCRSSPKAPNRRRRHEVCPQCSHSPEPIGCGPVCGGVLSAGDLHDAGSLIYTPGARLELQLPQGKGLPGTDKPTVSVAIDADGRLYYQNQWIDEKALLSRLQQAVKKSPEPLTLVVQADERVTHGRVIRLELLARAAGIPEALQATLPGPMARPSP